MILAAVAILGFPCVGLYFVIGRLVCPARDRLPFRSMDSTAIAQTISRGWNALPGGPASAADFTPVLPGR